MPWWLGWERQWRSREVLVGYMDAQMCAMNRSFSMNDYLVADNPTPRRDIGDVLLQSIWFGLRLRLEVEVQVLPNFASNTTSWFHFTPNLVCQRDLSFTLYWLQTLRNNIYWLKALNCELFRGCRQQVALPSLAQLLLIDIANSWSWPDNIWNRG